MRCTATTKAGEQCRRRALAGDSCEIPSHRAQVAGKGTVVRREPAKHQAKCKACQSPLLAEVESEWIGWLLTDAEAAQRVGASRRAWQRHAQYNCLYERRAAESILPYCAKVMERALRAEPTAASGITAAALAFKVCCGGERIIHEVSQGARDEFFRALDAADLTDDQLETIEGVLTHGEFRIVS